VDPVLLGTVTDAHAAVQRRIMAKTGIVRMVIAYPAEKAGRQLPPGMDGQLSAAEMKSANTAALR